jgi:hypothetical protein
MARHSGRGERGRACTAATLALITLVMPCRCTVGRFHHHPASPPEREGTTAGPVVGLAEPRAYIATSPAMPPGQSQHHIEAARAPRIEG